MDFTDSDLPGQFIGNFVYNWGALGDRAAPQHPKIDKTHPQGLAIPVLKVYGSILDYRHKILPSFSWILKFYYAQKKPADTSKKEMLFWTIKNGSG